MGSSVGPYQPLAGAGVPDSTTFLGLKREAGGTCNGTMVLTRVGGGMRGRVPSDAAQRNQRVYARLQRATAMRC